MVGLGDDSQMHSRATEIASIDPLALPLSRTMRFRDTNIETIGLVNPPSDFDGVLTDASGNVLGTWSSFAYDNDNGIAQALRGVPIDVVADMVDRVRSDRPLHSLDVELDPEPLASARQMGLSGGLGDEARRPQSHGASGADRDPHGRRLAGVLAAAAGRSRAGARRQGGH